MSAIPLADSVAAPLILIVDDDRSVHAIAGKMLERYDLTVLHAFDGAEGLRIARDMRPELIITDALLPRLDGRELSRAIKLDPELRSTKVVVMTGLYKGARYRHEAMADFLADDYIVKPLRIDKLREILSARLKGISHVS